MCYTVVLIKKEKKLKPLLHKDWIQKQPVRKSQEIATQSHTLCARASPPPLPLLFLHAEGQHLFQLKPWPRTLHRDNMLWPQHIFPHSLSNLGLVQTSLECTTFCRAFPSSFPCYCKRKQQCCQFSHQITFIPATAFRISLDFGSMGFWAWFPQG